ncbi:CmpA/NrtA family ABC transporter substrate-binding protein [uncultured Rhodoblastus sp.]|uniref:CmpA/NrtA family ABC transporter substrate-binding protein n=1 Tax=uncultured Rhodoblastus sp. TaxID=543037 RepID=UPI0025D77AD4|nr:CmpA/NrtA family ABC transporter substrate-binding protein [uncultured Rhodoblastus sp.]
MNRLMRISYLPLADAGLLFVASAKGFDREEGLIFELRPEASWANLRDKLALGICDAAHMLAPAVVASALGLEGFHAPMIGAVALGLDGNALSLSPGLSADLHARIDGDAADPAATARAFGEIVAERAALNLPPLRLAHVFPFSSHHYQLRLWLKAGKIDPGAVRLMVTPPPLMEASMAGNYIDGFCVGEPWSILAQQAGVAEILHPCRVLAQNCPEKVLAFPRDAALAEPELPRAAARAVRRAALWGESAENRGEFCAIVAENLKFGVGAAMVSRALGWSGQGASWLRLDAEATALDGSQALFVYALMAAAGQTGASREQAALAREAFWSPGGMAPTPSLPILAAAPFDPGHWRETLAALNARPSD